MGYFSDLYNIIKPFAKDLGVFVQVCSCLGGTGMIAFTKFKEIISTDQQEEMMASRKFKNILIGIAVIFLAGTFVGILQKYFGQSVSQYL